MLVPGYGNGLTTWDWASQAARLCWNKICLLEANGNPEIGEGAAAAGVTALAGEIAGGPPGPPGPPGVPGGGWITDEIGIFAEGVMPAVGLVDGLMMGTVGLMVGA